MPILSKTYDLNVRMYQADKLLIRNHIPKGQVSELVRTMLLMYVNDITFRELVSRQMNSKNGTK